MADDLFDSGIDFEFDNSGKKDARVWAHPKCKDGGPRPLLIWLHGMRRPSDHPQLSARLDRAWACHAGKLAQLHIDAGRVSPLLIAAPTWRDDDSYKKVWTKFDLAGFVEKVAGTVKDLGVEIDQDAVSVVGHSAAGCVADHGIGKIAQDGAQFGGHSLKVLGFCDNCYATGLAKNAAQGLHKKENTTTAIYAIHKGHGGGNSGSNPADYALGFGITVEGTAREFEKGADDYREEGAHVSIHLPAGEGLFAEEQDWLKSGALLSPWNHSAGYAQHYAVCLIWTSWALQRFYPASEQEKAEARPAPVEEPVTGGEWADVPAGPPAWNPPEERSPQMTGLAEFADPATALFWPVRTKNQHGRTVCFIDSDKKPVGIEHKGSFTTQSRHFLAPRSGTKGKRYHVGIDVFGDFHDIVVACEAGKILNFTDFYHGVWKLFVQCDSGLVINYGEVDKRSLQDFNLKPGDRIQAGQPIGQIGRMTGGSSMLHFETYPAGTRDNVRYWASDPHTQLARIRNPTQYLLALAKLGR